MPGKSQMKGGMLGARGSGLGRKKKSQRGGAWWNNWGDFKKGASDVWEAAKPIIKDNKIASKIGSYVDPELGKAIESQGWGKRRRVCKR